MSSSLGPLVEQWARLNPRVRCFGVCMLLVVALVGFLWPQHAPADALPTPKPIEEAPVSLLEPLSVTKLNALADQWRDVSISRQHELYSLNMRLSWAQLYQFAATLADSAHHPQSYRLQWPDPADASAATPDLGFTLKMQLQPGRYRQGANNFKGLSSEYEVSRSPVKCTAPPEPQVEVVAIWPSRATVELQTLHGRLRLKAEQLLDNTWILSVIERDLVQFSWQPPDSLCPVEVFTVAI